MIIRQKQKGMGTRETRAGDESLPLVLVHELSHMNRGERGCEIIFRNNNPCTSIGFASKVNLFSHLGILQRTKTA